MGRAECLALLRKLEWAGKVEVFGEDDNESMWVDACPECGGIKELPEAITVGDKYVGYAQIEVHPDHEDDVGHRPGCYLSLALRGGPQ